MFFRGRGITYLTERDANGIIGERIAICQDVLTIAMATESGEHINKCGVVDAPDDRYVKSTTGTVSLTFADVADKNFAIGVFGKLNAAMGSPAAVSDEVLPDNLPDNAQYGLGGLTRHRTITSLVIEDSDSPPNTLTGGGDDYTLDAAKGVVTFGDLSGFTQPLKASYSHKDPKDVALLAEAQKQYFLEFEGYNVRDNNAPMALELYSTRFDPAQNLDFLSDDLQLMELQGTMLSDQTKSADGDLGQFGRRVYAETA